VVHDDLEQYHQAINRYHESLRIRLNHLKTASAGESSDIEDSVLLTLKCMAHVYKLLDDLDNAIAFYIKALLLLKSKVSRTTELADKWQIMGMRFDLAVPTPTVIFDEMRKDSFSTGEAWKRHFQTINKKILCHTFSEDDQQAHSYKHDKSRHKLEKELSKMHSMVVALVQKKKHSTPSSSQSPLSYASSRKKVSISPASSITIEILPKSQLGNIFDMALMSSSFCLGRSRMSNQRYDEAVDSFEIALRTKWALDPALSSDSDSEASSSRFSSVQSKSSSRNISEDEPEEGQLYYALGLANAMLDDHERAVRCFITSLRYLRRALRKVDSLEVARVRK
jgi:tetratricopeptide (TPR) repeat protein